ncbi:DoxX family membrane protein [Lutibacter sp.]|uniref:DoxX family membrane protein n=1 Tax=Lutibacter sp. TaxID=1925666 RepID=UPI0035666EF3
MSIFNNHSAEILVLLFLIITFLQSGIDKLTDWKGNVDFITSHFKNSPLQKMVPLLLMTVLIFEVSAGILMIFGGYYLLTESTSTVAKIGLELAAITLLMLLIGQRLAKDYAGAMSITVYFILTILGLYLLN